MLRTSVSVCALITVLASSSAVLAQDPSLAGARAALAAYDLEGPATLNALADLGPIAARGGAPAVEARYLRAIAGADLYTLSIVLPDDALGARLADALGVPASDVSAHLRSELSATGRGPYRRSAVDENLQNDME